MEKRKFPKTFCGMQLFRITILIDDLFGFLELSTFIDTSLP